MGILIISMLCVYAIGTLIFWRNISFSGSRKAVFCLTIVPVFFGVVILDISLIDLFAPRLLTLFAKVQARDAIQAGTRHEEIAPVFGLIISMPIALIVAYAWFALVRSWERRQAGAVVPKNMQDVSPLRRLLLTMLPLLGLGSPWAVASSQVVPPMPKSLSGDTARIILAVPKNRSSWEDVIVKGTYSQRFIWDADGDEVERWNALANGLPQAQRKIVNGADVFLSYKEHTLKEPLVGGREDNIIAIHTLNRPELCSNRTKLFLS